jgi:carbon-monoxide dehydrogenase medium subunit
VKPAPVEYRRAHSVDEALELLAEHGDEAKLLAGGQSLIPMMNYRLARPEMLVDVGPVAELDYVVRDGDALRVGALARHVRLERYETDSLAGGFEVLAAVAAEIGHAPIRTLGTIGGSLAHADAAAEWCAAVLFLDAQVVLRSSARGERTVSADDFFLGLYTTALEPDEMVVEVAFPRPCRHTGFAEFAQRRGDFALTSAGVALEFDGAVCTAARIVVGGVSDRAIRVPGAEAALVGTTCDPAAVESAAVQAAVEVQPIDTTPGMAPYRRHLTRTMTARALTEAISR